MDEKSGFIKDLNELDSNLEYDLYKQLTDFSKVFKNKINWRDGNEIKYYIYTSTLWQENSINYTYGEKRRGIVYFRTKTQAQQGIDMITSPLLEKYFIDEEEIRKKYIKII